MSSAMSRLVRIRMAETGEKYTTALRAIEADPAEHDRLMELDKYARRRRSYPSTDRDGLDRRHLLSAFETDRSSH